MEEPADRPLQGPSADGKMLLIRVRSMLCALRMLTAFHGWHQARTALADGIFFGLAALAAHFDAARAFYPWQPSQRPQSGKSFGS